MKSLITPTPAALFCLPASAQPSHHASSAAMFAIGYSDGKSPYQIGWGLPKHGWERITRDRFSKALDDSGSSVLWLHNPFGAWPGKRMQWTQRQQLERHAEDGDEGARRMLDSFGPAMRNLLSGEYTHGRKITLVCYLGDAQTDDLLRPLKEAGDLDAWNREWSYACEPIVRLAKRFPGQVSLGADSSEELTEDHWHYLRLRKLHRSGLPVIIEPRPRADRPHLGEFGMASVWRQDRVGQAFDRTNPDRFQDSKGLANGQIKGNKYALLNKPDRITPDVLGQVGSKGITPVYWVEPVLKREQKAGKQ